MTRKSPFRTSDWVLLALFVLSLCGILLPRLMHIAAGAAFLAIALVHTRTKLPVRGRLPLMRQTGLAAAAILALLLAVVLVTGICLTLQSYGLRAPAPNADWRFWHIVLSLAVASALFIHVLTQASRCMEGWRLYGAAGGAFVALITALFGIPYADRWLRHVEIDAAAAIAGPAVSARGRTLVVYFSRSGNTADLSKVDAVSGASFMKDRKSGRLHGNAELLALMAQSATGAELAQVRVSVPYPPGYTDTVRIAARELRDGRSPEILESCLTGARYDNVILVFPLWWGTVPRAVESFFEKTGIKPARLLPVITHGSGGAGESVKALAKLLPDAHISRPLTVYSSSVPHAREELRGYLAKELN
jgi:hypothetical protein